jgi:hypothetical protein
MNELTEGIDALTERRKMEQEAKQKIRG